MKKFIEALAIALAIVGVGVIGLGYLGFQMHDNAKTYAEAKGFTDVVVLGQDDSILCSGSMTGIRLSATRGDETKALAICTDITGNTTVGEW